MTQGKPALGVAMVGYAFMGAAHSQAWRTVGRVYDLPVAAEMRVVCGRDEGRAREAADRLGWAEVEIDWRRLLERDDVDVVDVCTPGDSHAEIAIAALEAGKHVLCEKPLANTVEEAEAMTAAAQRAEAAGVFSMVGFNYRRVPAVALARQLVEQGRLGTIRHIRAQYLQDWIVDPEFPLVWRLQKDKAGSGALGDIGAHIVDLAQFVTGDTVAGVSALMETFVKQRPLAEASSGLSAAGSSELGDVTVDDASLFLARTTGGAVATFEATRFAAGRKNGLRLEVEGSKGSIAFEFESMNELLFHDHTEPAATAGFRRISVTEPEHPYMSAWWPAGHIIGYEHTFTHEVRDFLEAVGSSRPPSPSFADGLQVQRVLAAVEQSAAKDSCWTAVES
ncbi:putative dehydrogenase [Motilibacter peucedani]|uniref:Putative dehydrogenase n=1 Tax=Motilibacter peucedani TaxID=598650 RepID=A0A420XKH9_9ACTN|nr:Gfo/Idh/MocA family oxidoreductase [Motilibacter peucedani]RKS68533.1 putative dehydrogenase [Motilibacter peucedani]